MNSKQAADRMEEIEENLICYNSQFNIAKLNDWHKQMIESSAEIRKLIFEAKEIYEDKKDGCGKEWCPSCEEYIFDEYSFPCGMWEVLTIEGKEKDRMLCPDCQKIKESWERINEL